MSVRITLRQVAQKAGVHCATVSRALKSDSRLLPETITRIQAIAKELGYRPDPMLSSLSAYRWSNQTARFQSKLMWLVTGEAPSRRRNQCYDLYWSGAEESARQRGFELEAFWLDEPGLTAKRASKILYSRGVAGLLISPLQKARGHLSLEWDKFSCVAFGYSMIRPKLNLVTAHHYRAIITSVRRLRALGHRRIGFAWHRLMNERMDRLWSSAFAGELESLPESRSIPIFWMRENTKGDFLNWCKHHRPEAIITSSPNVLHWLNEAGYPVPEEVSVVIPFLQESETKFDGKIDHSGVVEPSRQIGRSAAELLMGMIARKECGIPPHPHRLLIEGWWHEGETTKRRRGRRGIGS